MSEKQFQIIHLGNPYEFVVKDNTTNKTYGPFEGDEKSMSDLLNQLYQENEHLIIGNKNLMKKNEQLKQEIKQYWKCRDKWKQEAKELKKENERLRNRLERKTILLKIRTKHIDDRVKSFHELLNYLESFGYKSNIDGNYAKQDIINILNNWEIREYD